MSRPMIHPMSKQEIMSAIAECAEKLGHPPTHKELLQTTTVSQRQIVKEFGTHTRALLACNLAINGPGNKLKVEALFSDWAKVARELKKIPSKAEFEHLAKSGQLFEAAALYRGDLLDGHGVRDGAFDDWLLIERRRLHDLAVEVLSRYAGSQAGEAGIETALRLLQIEPEREETQRLLMRLYAAANRRPLALRQYEVCRETLQRELGVEPDAETEALYRQIQNGAKPAISYEVNQTPAPRAPRSVPAPASR